MRAVLAGPAEAHRLLAAVVDRTPLATLTADRHAAHVGLVDLLAIAGGELRRCLDVALGVVEVPRRVA